MKYPPVIVVDEHDNEIGSTMLAEVWAKGLYHRIVSVFVQDEAGRLLLQLRAAHVKMFPGCWTRPRAATWTSARRTSKLPPMN